MDLYKIVLNTVRLAEPSNVAVESWILCPMLGFPPDNTGTALSWHKTA